LEVPKNRKNKNNKNKTNNNNVTGDKPDCESTDSSPLHYAGCDCELDQQANTNAKMAAGTNTTNTTSLTDKILVEESSDRDRELEVAHMLASMGTVPEKRTLFASPERMETIESLRYPESRNRASEDGTGFKADNVSEDDIGSMERNVRLGYVGLHYDDSELPEADDLLEVISAIEEQDARTLLDTGCSTYVILDDYVARNGIGRIPVTKQPIDLA
jgi:hypothetical protein